jgi:hypothetical protein
MKPIQQGRRVFCPKHNTVDIRGDQRNPANLIGIQRIAHQNKFFAQPVEKPVAVESWYVRPTAATDDHNYSTKYIELF